MKAQEFHSSMPGYRPTPLIDLPALATELAVGAVLVKDESERLGLPAFKILGASWAVNCALSKHGGYAEPATNLTDLRSRVGNAPITLVTATDGNHGRAVARMAHHLGLASRIYVPAGTSEKTLNAIAGEGVQVVETELKYDDVVRTAASSTANKPDEILIQDTAWPGYEEIPQLIVAGYDTMFSEIDTQLGEQVPDLIAVPTGVGSLLLAALQHCPSTSSGHMRTGSGHMRTSSGHMRTSSGHISTGSGPGPAVLAVEPVTAACVTASLAAHTRISVDTSVSTIMAGLNCGTISTIAWPVIRDQLGAAVTVTDDQARVAMQRLHELGIRAGPSGAASLAGVRVAFSDADQRAALAVEADTVVILISTEGLVE
jgi:diaminopropionate ammonia-lyase